LKTRRRLTDNLQAFSVVSGDLQDASSERALPETDRRTTHDGDMALNTLEVLSSSTDTHAHDISLFDAGHDFRP